MYECIKQFSETDFTADLRRITVPTLLIHGDDGQIVPVVASSAKTSRSWQTLS
jgi:non-heme chloroperoxidase